MKGNLDQTVSPLEGGFVHIERAVNLDLKGMHPAFGVTVIAGDESARIGRVSDHRITHLSEDFLD